MNPDSVVSETVLTPISQYLLPSPLFIYSFSSTTYILFLTIPAAALHLACPLQQYSTPSRVNLPCSFMSSGVWKSGTDLIGSSTIMELSTHGRKLGKSFGKKALIYLFICHSNFIELSLSTKHCSSPRGIQNDLQSPSLQET